MKDGELLIRFLNKMGNLSFPDNLIMAALLRGDWNEALDLMDYYGVYEREMPVWVTVFDNADNREKGRDYAFEFFVADFLEQE